MISLLEALVPAHTRATEVDTNGNSLLRTGEHGDLGHGERVVVSLAARRLAVLRESLVLHCKIAVSARFACST